MVLYSWLKRREIGLKNNIGVIDNIHKTVYTSFKSNDSWNDCSSGDSEHGGVFNLEFSLDGSILVAACERKSIVLFDPTSAKTIKTVYNAHSDCVNCVKFLDERMFATCSDDTTVAIWDTRNLRTKVKSLNGHSNWVKNIEYSKKDELLVTSGFDGSVFAWDINSSTENGFVYQKVFHTAGLMRCCVSPDANRLVICTTCGYLIIIHNLDLTTLAEDLDGFRPNMFRLMQISNQYYPCVGNYKQIFSSNNHRNRVEFIIDFPKGNDAEVVSSLQIHPQGWCALSRNMSYDEESEWTCVHDIQEGEPEKPENDFLMDLDGDLDETSSLEDTTNVNVSQPVLPRNFRALRRSGNRINNTTNPSTNPSVNISNVNRENCPPDIWAAEISITNRANRLRTPSSPSHVYGISSGIIRPQSNQQPTSLPDQKRYNAITKNSNRLLFYTKEPNKGKGFIKELCFSSDGRVICSPYNFGIRLLAFNKECSELPNALSKDNKANEMSPIKIVQSHSDIVVSAKFSPKQPLLVSGCLKGKVVWYYPVL